MHTTTAFTATTTSAIADAIIAIKIKKTCFLTESKERHKNLKRTEITPYMKWVFPSANPRSLR